MPVEPCVCAGNQLFIESPLIRAALISTHQQNCRAFGVKCKSHPPHPALTIETQLFHVCVLRTFERIHRWSAQMGAKFLKEPSVGEQFVLESAIHHLKLGVKIIVKEYVPRHGQIMVLKTYYFKPVVMVHCPKIRSMAGSLAN